jgi:hypothetical protein
MKGWESGLVVGVVMLTLVFLFQAITDRTTREAQCASQLKLPMEFRLAAWALNFYRVGLILSFIGAIAIIGLMEEGPVRNVWLFTPAFFAFLTGSGLIVDTKKRVVLTEHTVSYRSIFGSFEVALSSIKTVSAGGGFIILDIGEKTKKVIPMMFQNTGQILAFLQAKSHSAH